MSIADGPVASAAARPAGLVAYEVAARAELPILAAASSTGHPARGLVAANEHRFDMTYNWTDASRAAAAHNDFVRPGRRDHGADVAGHRTDDVAIREPAQTAAQGIGLGGGAGLDSGHGTSGGRGARH